MSVLVAAGALAFLMVAAYRGFSVILVAPLAAMGAILLIDPSAVAPIFTGVFMEKTAAFIKLYFPVFLLGAVFGKLVEISGYSESIVAAAVKYISRTHANLIIVVACALMTYGGVSVFVVVFAVYPFAAELYRQSDIPKRLMPGALALGSFSFTMDALPGTPQIQNIIPTTFFQTTSWAAPWLGFLGSVFIISVGLMFLNWRQRSVLKTGEGYGKDHVQDKVTRLRDEPLPNAWLAIAPLIIVAGSNFLFTSFIATSFGDVYHVGKDLLPGLGTAVAGKVSAVKAVWAVEGALLCGIAFIAIFAFGRIRVHFAAATKTAVSGAMLASLNTASEYGFGSVIALLPGFLTVSQHLEKISDPLIKAAVSVTTLSGITGSASGGLSIALGALSDKLILAANGAQIPLEVLHRVVAMASGGMDTLPHNGAVITLLAVTGLTHKESYKEIFGITIVKTLAVFFVIAVFYATGIV